MLFDMGHRGLVSTSAMTTKPAAYTRIAPRFGVVPMMDWTNNITISMAYSGVRAKYVQSEIKKYPQCSIEILSLPRSENLMAHV